VTLSPRESCLAETVLVGQRVFFSRFDLPPSLFLFLVAAPPLVSNFSMSLRKPLLDVEVPESRRSASLDTWQPELLSPGVDNDDDDNNTDHNADAAPRQQLQQHRQLQRPPKPLLQLDVDVDAAMREENERDARQLAADSREVQGMMQDAAKLVEEQGGMMAEVGGWKEHAWGDCERRYLGRVTAQSSRPAPTKAHTVGPRKWKVFPRVPGHVPSRTLHITYGVLPPVCAHRLTQQRSKPRRTQQTPRSNWTERGRARRR
jgi:hypothetical protein